VYASIKTVSHLDKALSLDALVNEGCVGRKLLRVLKPKLEVGQILVESPFQR
jgi:hypothetical protein